MSGLIKDEAKRLGFLDCGISAVQTLENERSALEDYLQKGFHGEMKYMENHFEMRLNPQLLVPGAKSVVSLLYNYFTSQTQTDSKAPIISKYAYGKDYHIVVKQKTEQLLEFTKKIAGDVQGRAFVDSAPIMERAWAVKAGLGWIGKNGLLLNKYHGSFFFIAELVIDLELDYNMDKVANHCGKCSRCIDACPTGALIEPGKLDACKCISYLTIELKNEIPEEFRGKFKDRVFGCDICQDVCPFNKKSKEHSEKEFVPNQELMNLSEKDWFEIDELKFNRIFKNSAVKRTKLKGLKRNLEFIKGTEFD